MEVDKPKAFPLYHYNGLQPAATRNEVLKDNKNYAIHHCTAAVGWARSVPNEIKIKYSVECPEFCLLVNRA